MSLPVRLDGQTKPNLPSGHYLDNRIYSDKIVFDREQRSIMAHCWRFVCHKSELREKYDYRLVNVAGHEIILLKDGDDGIRGYYNSCPHRGARLLRQVSGKLDEGRMVCFYHLWSFNSRGECLTVSQPSGYQKSGINRENTALKRVRVEVLYDLVFVCLDDEAPDLESFLGADVIDAMKVPFGTTELEVFHYQKTEIEANWKLFVETNCEGYHELLHLLNRTTAVSEQEYRSRQWNMHDNGHISFDPARIGYKNLDYEQREENVLPGMETNGHIVVNLFPDMMLNCRSTVVRLDSLIPVSPELTILECRGLGLRSDSEEVRAMRVRHHNQVWGPMGVNLAEDLWAVQTQMRNILRGSSKYSVIAREEEGPMSDASLRNFYTEWRRLTSFDSSDLPDPDVK